MKRLTLPGILALLLSFVPVASAMDIAGFSYDPPLSRPQAAFFANIPALDFSTPSLAVAAGDQTAAAEAAFRRGLTLTHGFWHMEAERHFREVMFLAPDYPLAYAFAAYVGKLFSAGDYARGEEYAKKCVELLITGKVPITDREYRWIYALLALYGEDKAAAEKSHVNLMRALVKDYPHDLEAKAFFALGLWHLQHVGMRAELEAKPEESKLSRAEADALQNEINQLLNDIFAINPQHPAHHYRIHLWNWGFREATHALASAKQAGPTGGRIAHLWHMPIHIFWDVRDFWQFRWNSELADRIDNKHLATFHLNPNVNYNYLHNKDWLTKMALAQGSFHFAVTEIMPVIATPVHDVKPWGFQLLQENLLTAAEDFGQWQLAIDWAKKGYLTVPYSLGADSDLQAKVYRLLSLAHGQLKDLDNAQLYFKKLVELRDRRSVKDKDEPKEVDALLRDNALWLEVFAARRSNAPVASELLQNLAKVREGSENVPAAPVSSDIQLALLYEEHDLLSDAAELLTTTLAATNKPQVLQWAILARLQNTLGEKEKSRQALLKFARAAILDVQDQKIPLVEKILQQNPGLTLVQTRRYDQAKLEAREELASFGPQFLQVDNRLVAASPLLEKMRQDLPGKRYGWAVFQLGSGCPACQVQSEAFEDLRDQMDKIQVGMVSISYDAGKTASLFKEVGVWDEFFSRPAHGVFLIDLKTGAILWHKRSDHAFENAAFLASETLRMLQLANGGSVFDR